MCCFSAETRVFRTNIFARVIRPGVQSLAYQMTFEAETPTAMILPLPVALPAREDSVRFQNLKPYPDFFSDLARGFPEPPPPSGFAGMRAATAAASQPLAVHEVGDFVASFVPQLRDFERVDPRFVISKDVWSRLPAYADYGFAVFQLKNLAGTPHPMAFEFESRLAGAVFFPTVHIHSGKVFEKDDFDHVLYVQNKNFDARAGSYRGPNAVDDATGLVRSERPAGTFMEDGRAAGLVDPALLVHKATLTGSLPNKDTLYSLSAHAPTSSGCGRCDVTPTFGSTAALPVAALAGLSWIIRRRAERGRK
ncbi:MAG: hypothetical protein IPG50_08590 [Myxococcales bacterium]|nr:hypothetical protein [Myxococcales bacterium]